MSAQVTKGLVYYCPACGAEVTVLAGGTDRFEPRCCNKPMAPRPGKLHFYYCPVCGAELVVLNDTGGRFEPRCCNRPMVLEEDQQAA
jgi:predicted RNA-binding Zn-ribbon protein involved in translation (DUF1610 family)